jgi:hypothetical protein
MKTTAQYKGYTIVKDSRGYWVERLQMAFRTLTEATDVIDWS